MFKPSSLFTTSIVFCYFLANSFALAQSIHLLDDINQHTGRYDACPKNGVVIEDTLYFQALLGNDYKLWQLKAGDVDAELVPNDTVMSLALYKGRALTDSCYYGTTPPMVADGNTIIFKAVNPGNESTSDLWSFNTQSNTLNRLTQLESPNPTNENYGTYTNSDFYGLTKYDERWYFNFDSKVWSVSLEDSDVVEEDQFTTQTSVGNKITSFDNKLIVINEQFLIYDTTDGNVVSATIVHSGQNTKISDVGVFHEKDGDLYFAADIGDSGLELWRYSKINNEVTLQLDLREEEEICDGEGYCYIANSGAINALFSVNDNLYFYGTDGEQSGIWEYLEQSKAQFLADVERVIDVLEHNGDMYLLYADLSAGSRYSFTGIMRFEPSSNDIEIVSKPPVSVGLLFESFDNKIYFAGEDAQYGQELWSYNNGNTGLVSDLNNYSDSAYPSRSIKYNGKVYFIAFNGEKRQMYVFDPKTKITTSINNDILSALSYSLNWWDMPFVIYKNRLYFSASNEETGFELWSYDSDTDTAKLASEILTAPEESSYPSDFYVFDDKLFFSASTDFLARKIFIFDDDDDSVTSLGDLYNYATAPYTYVAPYFLESNGSLYFNMKVDGHLAMHKIDENGVLSEFSNDYWLSSQSIISDNKIYTIMDLQGLGYQLWMVDIDTKEFELISEPQPSARPGTNPSCMISHNNAVYFVTAHPNKLFKYTLATKTILEIAEVEATTTFACNSAAIYKDTLFFETSTNLYSYNTETGVVSDFLTTTPNAFEWVYDSSGYPFNIYDNRLYFSGRSERHGRSLFEVFIENSIAQGQLVIEGEPIENNSLKIIANLVDLDGAGKFTYQWFRDSVSIDFANENEYTLTDEDVGKAMSASATYVDFYDNLEIVQSAETELIANINDPVEGDIIITGSPAENERLGIDIVLSDEDGLGSYSYQWAVDGEFISNETNETYLIRPTDVNKKVSVTVSFVDGFGTLESVTSLPVRVESKDEGGSLFYLLFTLLIILFGRRVHDHSNLKNEQQKRLNNEGL